MADLLDKTLEWIKANVAIAAGIGVAVVLILGVGGYFALSGKTPAKSATGAALTPEQQAAIAQGVCGVTMQLVHDYGVLPPDSKLAATEAKETGKPGFESCQAQAGLSQYAMVSEVTCEDLSNAKCVALDSVKASDGTALYQRRPYSSQPMPPPVAEVMPQPQPDTQPDLQQNTQPDTQPQP